MRRLEHAIRWLPLLALPDGTYVVADGPVVVVEKTVGFAVGADAVRTMGIEGFDPVRWPTGGQPVLQHPVTLWLLQYPGSQSLAHEGRTLR